MRIHIASFLVACLCATGLAATPASAAVLVHTADTRGPAPIPAAERSLQTVTASHWHEVTKKSHVLEGAIADEADNLYFCDVSAKNVLLLTKDRKMRVLASFDDMAPAGLTLGRDGRVYAALINQDEEYGAIVAVDGKGQKEIILDKSLGYLPNDLVFDAQGGFYFTDFKGTYGSPTGGVYHVSGGKKTITPILKGLVLANGIALSPDGRVLWATEFGRNLLHRIELQNPTTPVRTGISVPYHFQGPAPDSMRIDSEGNVYVALYTQGRVLVLSPNGVPIGQILLPGRNEGNNLLSTSLAISPSSTRLFIVAGNATGERGAHIFESLGLARGIAR